MKEMRWNTPAVGGMKLLSRKLALSGLLSITFATSCTPKGEVVSQTSCSAAIATATYAWEVAYFPERFRNDSNKHRIETFTTAVAENRNRQKPEGSVIGPDDEGVWWPVLPARPTVDDIDARRDDDFRYNDPPLLQRSLNYVLQCEDGKFLANDQIYRRVSQAIAAGQTVQATYSLGQLLKTEILELGETLPPPPETDGAVDAGATSTASAQTVDTSPVLANQVLYVDPAQGNNSNQGSDRQPFKTITHALAVAQPGQIIQLTPGLYDLDSGETFPLQLQSGVTLQGNVAEQGKGITIQGGGSFLSPTWARQNVGLVAVDLSTVQGITLTNPNTRGTAVWVEDGSPVIASNVFADNNREGVFVSGDATPQILSNLIKENGGNGVSFTRSSSGVLAGNSIRTSGYGVAISERAFPTVEANQIIQNRSGVVISGDAEPVLRGNTIRENVEDGIIATNQSQPILEGNTLSDNGEFDINSNSSNAVQLQEDASQLKVQGKIEQKDNR